MLIGEVADAAGVSAQTIRFYERKGLLATPARSANGYRRYDESALTRLHFILSAQAAGLTLAEIGGIVALRDSGTVPCTHVAHLIDHKLDEVRTRIRDLTALTTELSALRARSRRLAPADCTDADVCHILTGPQTSDVPKKRPAMGS